MSIITRKISEVGSHQEWMIVAAGPDVAGQMQLKIQWPGAPPSDEEARDWVRWWYEDFRAGVPLERAGGVGAVMT
ncbi:MAG: hypothetical protein ACYTFA_12405 [Planctomycetota bacterium]|jgi:hypothetical protein